jgi:hypothetical protein
MLFSKLTLFGHALTTTTSYNMPMSLNLDVFEDKLLLSLIFIETLLRAFAPTRSLKKYRDAISKASALVLVSLLLRHTAVVALAEIAVVLHQSVTRAGSNTQQAPSENVQDSLLDTIISYKHKEYDKKNEQNLQDKQNKKDKHDGHDGNDNHDDQDEQNKQDEQDDREEQGDHNDHDDYAKYIEVDGPKANQPQVYQRPANHSNETEPQASNSEGFPRPTIILLARDPSRWEFHDILPTAAVTMEAPETPTNPKLPPAQGISQLATVKTVSRRQRKRADRLKRLGD